MFIQIYKTYLRIYLPVENILLVPPKIIKIYLELLANLLRPSPTHLIYFRVNKKKMMGV